MKPWPLAALSDSKSLQAAHLDLDIDLSISKPLNFDAAQVHP